MPLSPPFSWADVNSENMTQAATWIQYLALLMWFTDTKESIPKFDNPHDAVILSKPLPSISEPQRRRIDFSKWRDPTSKNISQAQIYREISIETPSITYILADHFHHHRFDQDSTVVLSFQQSPCNGTVRLMCVWVHQLREELLKYQGFLYDDSSGNGTESMQSKH